MLLPLAKNEIYSQESSLKIERQLSIKITKHWIDTLKKYNGGENWIIKDASEFLKRKGSPYWTVTSDVHQMDIPISTQRRPGTIQRCDLSNNNLTGELADNTIYRWSSSSTAGYEAGIFAFSTEYWFSYNNLTSVTADIIRNRTNYQSCPVIAFDHNKLTNFNPKFHNPSLVGNAHGAMKIWLNNNKLSTYNADWDKFGYDNGVWFLKANADFIRMENNLFNFKELKKVNNCFEKRLSSKPSKGAPYRNPEFKFTYAPQIPQGVVSEQTISAGDNINLSFSLPDEENVYSWELNGKDIPLSEGKSFLSKMDVNNAGMYCCKVTNPALPDLTIYSAAKMVFMHKEGNQAPSDFNINKNKALSKSPQWTVVGEFGGDDPDGDQLYFRLVGFEDDNADFRIIDGNTLVSSTVLFERTFKTEYNIIVEAYDIYGGRKTKEFTITRGVATNPVPTSVKLNKLTVDENFVGKIADFKLTGVDIKDFTFLLPDTKDNVFFTTEDSVLKTKSPLNFEKQRYYTIRVTAKNGDVEITKDFRIEAININDAPSDVLLTSEKVEIEKPAGTFIAIMVATDDDPEDTDFTYEVESDYFVVRNKNQLMTKSRFLYDDIGEKPVKIKITDPHGAVSEITKTISIVDIPTPVGAHILINNQYIDENSTGVVGALSVSEAGTYTYSLVTGEGSEHNSYFEIDGNNLIVTKSLDYEGEKILNVRIKAKDVETKLKLFVNNVNEAPEEIGLSNFIAQKEADDTVATIVMKDVDGDTGIFSLTESDDYNYFEVRNQKLVLVKDADKKKFELVIKASDGEYEIEKNFSLRCDDIETTNSAPETIGLTNFILSPEWGEGTMVSKIVMYDVDAGEGTFILDASNDNDFFEISGNVLQLKKTPQPDKKVYTIRIAGVDNKGESLESEFSLYMLSDENNLILKPEGDNIIYPNPGGDIISVKIDPEVEATVELKLYDLKGVVRYQKSIDKKVGEHIERIEMAELPQGAYYVELFYNLKRHIIQVIHR